jgi:hypothetical protein
MAKRPRLCRSLVVHSNVRILLRESAEIRLIQFVAFLTNIVLSLSNKEVEAGPTTALGVKEEEEWNTTVEKRSSKITDFSSLHWRFWGKETPD